MKLRIQQRGPTRRSAARTMRLWRIARVHRIRCWTLPGPKALGFYRPSSLQQSESARKVPLRPKGPADPSLADWTWLNGTSREAVGFEILYSSLIRYALHLRFQPSEDDTMGRSTEAFGQRSQMEQLSFGGDFHWNNVRGRVLTMNGLFAVTTPETTTALHVASGILRARTVTFRRMGRIPL
jgi:hypothetical protein